MGLIELPHGLIINVRLGKKAAEKEAPTAHPYHFVKKIELDLFT